MPSLIFRSYETILQQMISTIVARSALSDVTDSSVFKHLLAAPARELDEVNFQLANMLDLFSLDTAVGEDLDQRAKEIQPALIARNLATKAVGTVVFSRSGTSGTVTIPAGTVVKSGSVKFSTITAATIANTFSTSDAASAVAQVAGPEGNVVSGTLLFDSKPAGVDTVSAPQDFIGGQGIESDDAFRARIKLFISTLARCTPEALEFVATGVTLATGQRVASAHVVEDMVNRGEVYLYLDDGAGTIEQTSTVNPSIPENLTEGLGGPGGGPFAPNAATPGSGDTAIGGEEFLYTNFKPMKVDFANIATSLIVRKNGTVQVFGTDFLLNDPSGEIKMIPPLVNGDYVTAGYTHYDGLIAAVQKLVDGDPEDRANFPGWRAAGVRVHCQAPQVLQQLVTASVITREGFTKATVLTNASNAIQAYINNLGISGDVIRAALIERIMEVPGVSNVFITSPAGDVVMHDTQLARVTAAGITLT